MLKYANSGVVFQEIPDEVSLAINISNCPCRCPGCHSAWLWGDVGDPLTPEAIDSLLAQAHGVTCVSFMGGDADPAEVSRLAGYVRRAHPGCKVAWFSGRASIPPAVCRAHFDYIKTGPYLAHLGALNKHTTNQRLYRKNADGEFEDITHRFWRE